MKYTTFLALLFICLSPALVAQEKKQSVNLEGLGSGVVYSIGYERVLYNNTNYTLSGRVGIGVFKFEHFMTTPIEVINGFGQIHRLELGVGYSPFMSLRSWFGGSQDFSSHYRHIIPLRLGYAYYPEQSPLMYRLGFTPLLDIRSEDGKVFPILSGYISVGYRF